MLHSVAPSDVENPPRESVIFQAGQRISACSSIEEVAQCLLNIVVEEFSPLIARVVYTDGTNRRIAAYRDDRISDDEANRLENDIFVPLAKAVKTESPPGPLMEYLDAKEAGFVACHCPIVNLQNGEPWATVAIIVGNSRDAHETLARKRPDKSSGAQQAKNRHCFACSVGQNGFYCCNSLILKKIRSGSPNGI